MRPLPDGVTDAQWSALMAGAHELAVQADIMLNGQVVAEDIPVLSGSIQFDATAGIYSRLSASIATPDRLPATTSDVFAPSGYEIRVSRGVKVDGVELLVPLGVFPIATASIDVPGKVTQVSAWDRSWRIQRARFESYYHVTAGQNYADAIANLLQDRWPSVATNFPSIDFTTPHLVFDGWSDPWNAAQRMARSCGYSLRFDGGGVAVMVQDATFQDAPAATLTTKRNAVSVSHTLDAQNAFNAQTVRSANPSTAGAFSATVVDDDPESITWWDGPFGHVPAEPRQSEFAISQAHCEAEARSILARTRGLASTLRSVAAPDPRWEPGDVILADVEELGMQQPHILESVTIGLSPADAMQLGTRTRQVVTLG